MKGKKATILILAMLLSLGTPAAFSKNDKLSVDYTFELVMMDSQYGQWMIKDTQILEIPGEPLIPYRAARILLPQSAELKDIKVKYDKPIAQTGIDLPWGQPPCTFSDTPVKVGRNEETYSSNNWYPDKLFEVIGVEYFRGFAILNVHLFPVQYQPKSGTVNFYEKLTVEVQFGQGMKNKLYRGLAGDKSDVSGMVDNPEMVGTYEDGSSPLQNEEYIIITNDTMQSIFQQLANWKASYVNGTGVYTVSWITANYSGVDNAEKVRNFIIDKYTNNGTKYVLMGGDVAAVPYRGFYVSTGGYTDSDMLADMYFAHLDGSHNSDGDGNWGETNDNVDFTAEIAVGRAPAQSTTEAQAFVNKVIAYEQMTKPERVCFHQSRVQPGNSPDSRCLAYNCDNYIPGGYYIDYVFEENGTVSKTVWRNAWAAGPIVVVHIGHGNTNVYHINYEVGGTVSWYNSDCSSLTNTFFPWTTSVACITGEIEANDCLAEAYVMDDCGAIGAIYNDNYGWFSTLNACQYSGEFCEMEVRACWNDGYEKLGDILNRARSYLASSAQSNSYYRWCYYERNLVGDPETPCLTKRAGGPPPDTVTITNPSNGETVWGTVNITVSYTGDIDEVQFYIDGTWKYTDSTAPFSWNWDTTQYPNGGHTVLVRGYCAGVFMDEDTVSVTVNNEEYIIITNSRLQSTFQTLANWKANFVNGTGVYTVSWIEENFPPGDTQERIRNFIFDRYINHGTKYVLLGGDVDVVPYRGFYVSSGGYIEYDMPADMYYAHLDGSHNADGDSRYGEINDNVDFTAEVAVGRAPVETVAEAEAFVNKVIAYEQADKPKIVVLHRAGSNYCDLPDLCDDWVPFDYEIIYLFGPSMSEWLNAWASNPLLFQHMGDGNTNCIEISPGVYWCNEDVSTLTNTFWPVFMSPASFAGDFTADDCLAEELIKDVDNGAIAGIVNASYLWSGWGDECMYSPEFIEAMFKALFDDGKEHLGDMLNQGKSYLAFSAQSNSTYRWCFYAFNLIGDPETPVLTKRNGPSGTIYITNPLDGSTVHRTVNIATSTIGCIDTVKFYIAHIENDETSGELLCEDTALPFECSWDTNCYPPGWYTIRADGYYAGQVKDVDEITVFVDSCRVFITNPIEGETVDGTVTVTVDTKCVDTVQFYIDGALKYTDTTEPFQYGWNTTYYSDGTHTITAKGYELGVFICEDEVTCAVNNSGEGLGTMLLAFLLLFGCAGILTRRRRGSMYHTRTVNLKGKRAAALTLVMVLSLSIPAALSSADTFTVEYQFSPAPLDGCDGWIVKDTIVQEIPGEPLIPYRACAILLPQDAVVKDVKVKHSNPIVQEGIDIPWGQPPCTFSGPKSEKVGKNEEIYNSDNVYPNKLYEVIGVESFRGFQILLVHLYPVQYQPKPQTMYFYEKMTVEVKFGKGLKDKLYRGLLSDKEEVATVVDNPDMVKTYQDGPAPLQTEEYIIITNEDLQCIFHELADHKSCYVNGTGVYTVSWIEENFPPGDTQERIRNFIIDRYTNHGTKYVLLGGDVDVVPYRGFYVSVPPYEDEDMAADMYYAHLHGNFDADGDGIYAEPEDDVDWYAEVGVGRAPCENITEAQNFVDKVIAYEQAEKPKRVLLHQSRVLHDNIPDSTCLASNCGNWVPYDYTIDYLFEEDQRVTKNLWIQYWGYNPLAVAHIGHGSTSSYYINYEVGGGHVYWSCSDIPSLTNTFWPWHTTVACYTGRFTANDCLAECYVMDPDNGAIACIHNDNYGWFSYSDACKYSGEFCEMEFKACFTDGKQNLGDMLNQARSYLVSSAQTYNTYRWCFYERNLLGDPETPCLTQRIPTTITITNPTDGSDVYNGGPINITTEGKGYIASVKFYLIYINETDEVVGELLCEDPFKPFECTWDPTGYTTERWYTIRADAYWCGQVKDVDEITVRLRSPSSALYPTRIVTYASGEGLGTALLSLLVLFGFAGIMARKG